MNLLNLSTRERTILMLFIVVCCVGAANFLIYQPALREQERLEAAIESAARKAVVQKRLIVREGQMPEVVRQTLEAKIQKAADPEVFSGILSEIENAARAVNIRVVEMKPQAVVSGKGANQFPVNVAADGNLKDLIAFIHFLQAPEHGLDITQCFLERPFGESASVQAKIVIVRSLIRPAENERAQSNAMNVPGQSLAEDEGR